MNWKSKLRSTITFKKAAKMIKINPRITMPSFSGKRKNKPNKNVPIQKQVIANWVEKENRLKS